MQKPILMENISSNKFTATRIIIFFVLMIQISISVNAGYSKEKYTKKYSNGSIGNFVWFDRDQDGRQDVGEPGLNGVVVALYDGNGFFLSSTVTDISGNYIFEGLDTDPSGKVYEVFFKLPVGFRYSPNAGIISGSDINSDADEISGKTGFFKLMPGQINNDTDAGFISSINGTLPLHRLDLSATLRDNKVTLKWVAENEMNTKQFFIQQSFDGILFTDIGRMVVAGQVNTPTQYVYFNDLQSRLLNNFVYFRIKAEDNIQRFAYSNIALLRVSKSAGIRVWPNPVGDFANITYNSGANTILDINVLNSLGNVVKKNIYNVSHGLNQLTVNGLELLPSGVYFIRITDSNNNHVFSQKISK